jgi:hypothetical protein
MSIEKSPPGNPRGPFGIVLMIVMASPFAWLRVCSAEAICDHIVVIYLIKTIFLV